MFVTLTLSPALDCVEPTGAGVEVYGTPAPDMARVEELAGRMSAVER